MAANYKSSLMKVFPWKQVSRDINRGRPPGKTTSHNPIAELVADPIDDLIALGLASGELPARDAAGKQIKLPVKPSDFNKIYVWPQDVNSLLSKQGWIESWAPKSTEPRKMPNETLSQRAVRLSWPVVVREEATRHCKEILQQTGERTSIRSLSEYLRRWATQHKITTNRGSPPTSGAIRNQLKSGLWKMP